MQAHCSQLLFIPTSCQVRSRQDSRQAIYHREHHRGKAQVDEKGQAVSGTIPSTTGGWAGSTKLHHSYIDTSKACISDSIGATVQAHCSQLLFIPTSCQVRSRQDSRQAIYHREHHRGKAQVDEKGQAVSGTIPPLVEADRSQTGEQAT